ncbi:MAG: helix-turn-helix transcriptional regulator [Solirubrobacteraceae bacterium]
MDASVSLLGRTTECALLDELSADVRRGTSRSLILRGAPGVGKTALLDYLVDSNPDLLVVQASGVESEMELAHASLHQLCRPLLERVAALPGPQRDALEVVFGLSSGSAPSPFLVALAVLSVLSNASQERPVLCVVDDAQWLDRASAQALAFVSRRLGAEPVGLVCAARDPGEGLRHLPELAVEGLRNGDARALLTSAVRFKLDERAILRLVAETEGNPLALLELPRSLSVTELAGFEPGVTAELPHTASNGYQRQLDALPRETRSLLVIAAADPLGEPELVWKAAEAQGIGPEAAAAAVDSALCEFGARVRFRHPLVRAVAYRAAPAEERRGAHAALAEVIDIRSDPDLRAWHRALAAAGPDEDVADELESSAARARARGGQSAAAAFLQRSMELSVGDGRRAERALAAAEASYLAGSPEDSLRLASVAEGGPSDELRAARIQVLRGRVATMQRRIGDAPPLLLGAARQLQQLEPDAAREAFRDAFVAAVYAGRFSGEDGDNGVQAVAAAVRESVTTSEPTDLRDAMLVAAALIFEGDLEASVATAKRVVADLIARPSQELSLQWLFFAIRVLVYHVWDSDACDALTNRVLDAVREAGALALLPMAAGQRVGWELFAGNLTSAAAMIDEQNSVQEVIGGERSPGARLALAAFRGQKSEVARIEEAMKRGVGARSDGPWAAAIDWSSAVLGNGHGDYDGALRAAQRAVAHPSDVPVTEWALGELVEAAVRRGQPDAAIDAIDRLDKFARALGTDWVRGVATRARALVANDEQADELYRRAIEHLDRTPVRTELARTRLLYGEWLRRRGRRADAREQLRAAHDMLIAIGMTAFAERAGRELQASGEKVRARVAETRDELTPQELQIATLARDGLSNPEIAARLFLSPRTIEWHLGKVFLRLGIRSRRELRGSSLVPPQAERRVLARPRPSDTS